MMAVQLPVIDADGARLTSGGRKT